MPFENIEISLDHEYMAGGSGSGGYVWVLRVREKQSRLDLKEKELRTSGLSNLGFEIMHSLHKTPLQNKQKEIQNFIRTYIS